MMMSYQPYTAEGSKHPLFWPFCISCGAHLLLLGLVFFSPGFRSPSSTYLPSVIDVRMVDLSQIGAAPAPPSQEVVEQVQAPVEEQPSRPDDATVSIAPPDADVKPEVSVAPVRKENKSALKYKTIKPAKVVKNTLQRVEKKVDNLPPKPLEDTIKRLREKVAKEGQPGGAGADVPETQATGTGAGFGRGKQKEIEQIDLYQLDVAYAVNKNWAFAEQLAGASNQLEAKIIIKIMPDGQIADIFFTDRSGNAYLDDSAYKAIVKTSPVKPFPEGLNRPFIEMGLRFTPKGVF